jgi:hypothetical protein
MIKLLRGSSRRWAEEEEERRVMNLKTWLHSLTTNNMIRMVASKRLV